MGGYSPIQHLEFSICCSGGWTLDRQIANKYNFNKIIKWIHKKVKRENQSLETFPHQGFDFNNAGLDKYLIKVHVAIKKHNILKGLSKFISIMEQALI